MSYKSKYKGEEIDAAIGKANTALQQHQDISKLATKDEVGKKQDALVSGTNIKTINGESILGKGNIVIKGGVTEEYVNNAILSAISTTLNTPV